MSTKMGDQNSDEWERIRNFVGGANKKSKHPIQQEMDRLDMRKPQHLDEGGEVDPLSDDSKRLLAPQGAGTMTPSPFAAPQAKQPLPPLPPLPQNAQQPLPPVIPQVAPSVQAPMTPSGQDYDQQASKILGGIDPQQLKDYLTKVNTPTLGQRFGSGASGLADALVGAGGGHSNFQGNFNQQQQQQREALSAIPGQVSSQGKEQYGLSQQLQAKDPNSPLSKVSQKAYGPDLIKAGIPSNKIQFMSASLISDVLAKRIDSGHVDAEIEKARSEAALAGATLGLHGEELKNTARHQRTEEQQKEEEVKDKALHEATEHPLLHPVNAWKANQALAQKGGVSGFAPDVTAYAQKHGITPEQAQAIKDKRTAQ